MAVMSEIAQLQDELTYIEDQLGKLYRLRDPILARLAELRGPYEMPPPSRRTETQQKVAYCPRCSGRLDGSG